MDFEEQIDRNLKLLRERDSEAKKRGMLVGRYIKEPFADGHAIYEIIKENKKTVRIKAVNGIGDDWRIPYWGEEAIIDKNYAIGNIEYRDRLALIFS